MRLDQQRPHVSEALKHLRLGVTASGAVLALCLVAQTLIWMSVFFTNVQTRVLEPPEVETPGVVVQGGAPVPSEALVTDEPAPINIVPSRVGAKLDQLAEFTQTVGVLAAAAFGILLFQAVVVAGGACVPGVHLAVTAASWGLIIVGLSLPWSGVLPDMAYSGVFGSYDTMQEQSQRWRTGGAGMTAVGFFGGWVGLPLLLVAGVVASVARFRIGIEQGIIVTHASQLDEKLEREIRDRKTGELSKPRTVGALNQAMGGMQAEAPEPVAAKTGPEPMSNRPDGKRPI